MANNIPNKNDYKKIAEWLDIYHTTEDLKQKEQVKSLIVSRMYPVVRNITRTIARRATDPIEDLIQVGFIGLLKAIDRYDAERNDNFKVYAGYFIIGEMRHYLRDQLDLIKVPRYIQELSVRMHNFTRDLTIEDLNKLTCQNVAKALNTTPKIVDVVMETDRRGATLSLDGLFTYDDCHLGYEELFAAEDYKEASEYEDARIVFKEVLKRLPASSKFLAELYFDRGLSKKDIANILMISQSSVARRIRNLFNLIAEKTIEVKINFDEIFDDEDL